MTVDDRKSSVVKTIVFEDHGQDFLEWDIDAAGKVVAVRPPFEFQVLAWVDRRVVNPEVRPGELVEVVVDELAYLEDIEQTMPIKFPVKEVR